MREICKSRLTMTLAVMLVLASFAAAQQNQINTVVGGGPNDMPALDADLYTPYAVAVDASGNYYFTAYSQHRVFKVNSSGFLTVVAGNGLAGYSGDGVTGGAAQAMLNYPQGVAVDSHGNVYIADTDNCVVRKVDTTNTVTTVAGSQSSCGYDGDGSPATSYDLSYPTQLAVDSSNNVYIADLYNARIRKLTVSTGTITTVAGNGNGQAYCANGTIATSCAFAYTPSVAVDSSGDIFLTDAYEYVLYEVKASTGKITTIAGTPGTPGGTGDGHAATSAEIYPSVEGQLAVNGAGTIVWLADFSNYAIRQITVGGNIKTVVGQNDVCGGISGVGGPATSACVGYPTGIAADTAGDLFITNSYEYNYEYVLEVPCSLGGSCTAPTGDTAGDLYAVAGNGSGNNSTPVNGVPALGVTLYDPYGVYQDTSSNILIGDFNNNLVRELLNSSGNVNAFAGNGTAGYAGDGGLATASGAEVYGPVGIARDASGNIFFADQYNSIIREVNSSGTMSTFAGIPGSPGYSGDGGPAANARLYYPNDVYVDSYGNMFITDYLNNVIREVVCATTGTYACVPPAGETAGYIYTVAGNQAAATGYGGDGGPATGARLNNPQSAATDADGNLYIADTSNNRIRMVNAATGIINTVAGNGSAGFSGDGPALENTLSYPNAVRADANGNIFIADTNNNRIRWVDGGGTLITFAGNGTAAFTGDEGPAISAELYYPGGLFEDASGDFLIADTDNFRIRKINAFAAVGRSTGSIVFGTQPKGIASYPFEVTLSGIGPAVIGSLSTTGDFSESDDCVGSLPNGTTCTVAVYFTPTLSGARYGTLTVNTNGYFSTSTTISLEGTGTGLTLTPNPLGMGSTPVNTAVTKSVTVKGGATYTSVTLSGDTTDFSIASDTCTGMVASTCSVGIKFDPLTTGAKKATLILKDNDPTSPQALSITGTGSSFESFSPTSVSFATTVDGSTSKATKVTFKYTGTGTLALTALTPSSSSFIVNETGITSSACAPGTTTLTQNQFCYFNVEFAPGTASGPVTGSVTASFTGDANNPSSLLPLTGTATEASLSPATLAFGTVASGTKNESLTVKNLGSTPLTFNGTPTISGTGSGQFKVLPYSSSPVTSTCLNGSVTLANGQSCTFTVQFTSTGAGTSYTETLSVSDNGGASPQTAKMTAKD